MSSVFTQIIRGELPGYRLWENRDFIAILDINPVSRGHILVVPKKEVSYVFDLEDSLYEDLWKCSRWLASSLKRVTGKRIGIAVEGLSIAHVHVHLVPIESVGDLDPCKARVASAEELEEMQSLIVEDLRSNKSLEPTLTAPR